MRLRSIVLVLFLLVPVLPAQGTKEDDRIYDVVRRKLADDEEVKGAGFDVIVKNGAVTLKGRVHTDKDKEKATRIVKKVKGVASVDNQLKLFSAE